MKTYFVSGECMGKWAGSTVKFSGFFELPEEPKDATVSVKNNWLQYVTNMISNIEVLGSKQYYSPTILYYRECR